jgi:hypothetical protein
VPSSDVQRLRSLGATEFFPRKWEYEHPAHTLEDFQRPGYFAGDARSQLMVGDEIHYTLKGGSKLPSEWQRGIAAVEEKPSTRELPVVLAGIHRFAKATPWRVGFEPESKSKKAA